MGDYHSVSPAHDSPTASRGGCDDYGLTTAHDSHPVSHNDTFHAAGWPIGCWGCFPACWTLGGGMFSIHSKNRDCLRCEKAEESLGKPRDSVSKMGAEIMAPISEPSQSAWPQVRRGLRCGWCATNITTCVLDNFPNPRRMATQGMGAAWAGAWAVAADGTAARRPQGPWRALPADAPADGAGGRGGGWECLGNCGMRRIGVKPIASTRNARQTTRWPHSETYDSILYWDNPALLSHPPLDVTGVLPDLRGGVRRPQGGP